jgi:hypothetical protein
MSRVNTIFGDEPVDLKAIRQFPISQAIPLNCCCGTSPATTLKAW